MPGWHGYKAHRVAKGMPKGIGYHIGGRFPMLRQRYNPTGGWYWGPYGDVVECGPKRTTITDEYLKPRARARAPDTGV